MTFVCGIHSGLNFNSHDSGVKGRKSRPPVGGLICIAVHLAALGFATLSRLARLLGCREGDGNHRETGTCLSKSLKQSHIPTTTTFNYSDYKRHYKLGGGIRYLWRLFELAYISIMTYRLPLIIGVKPLHFRGVFELFDNNSIFPLVNMRATLCCAMACLPVQSIMETWCMTD